MASIRNEIPLQADAAKVWDALRDFGAVHTRVAAGFVTECRLEGQTRVVTFVNGLVAREVLVDVDEGQRRLVYAILDGRTTHYNASVQVLDRGAGQSAIVWIIDLLPDEMAGPVRGMAALAVAAMKKTLEGAR